MPKIYTFIIKISFLLFGVAISLQAQDKKKEPELPKVKWWNGYMIQIDVASLISSAYGGDSYSMEGGVQIDLKHKYFPIVEIGYAGADKTSNDQLAFKTNGLFSRVGIDFNLVRTKKDAKPTSNLFLFGFRLGTSNFSYDLTNVKVTDDYWGGSEIRNFTGEKTSKIWYELVLGVRVEVCKNIFMGWSVRSKSLIGTEPTDKVSPWYIPGYGVNTSSNIGLNYTVGYHF